MFFLLLLSISLAALTQVEIGASGTETDLKQARANARAGLLVALGQLQKAAGADQRAMTTANAVMTSASDGNGHWLGVWDTKDKSADPVWLVSSKNNATPGTAVPSASAVTIVGTGTLGNSAENKDIVRVEKVALPEDSGHFAWWISDQSMKASATDGWIPQDSLSAYSSFPSYYKPDSVKRSISTRAPMRRGIEEALPGISPDGSNATKIKNSINLSQLDMSGSSNAGEAFHDVSLGTLGLLTNPVDGGFKYNLTGATADPYGFLNDSLVSYLAAKRSQEYGTNDSPYTGTAPFTLRQYAGDSGKMLDDKPMLVITPPKNGSGSATPLFPDQSKKGEGYFFASPIQSEFLFRLSVVGIPVSDPNGPNDRNLTVWMRGDFITETWNPYPFAIELTRQTQAATLAPLRFYTSNFTNKVTIKIKRPSGSGNYDVIPESVGTFDITDGRYNTNLAIPSYIEYFNNSLATATGSSGTNSLPPAILYPGEVYAGRHPHTHWKKTWDTVELEQLNREVTPTSQWKFTSDPNDLLTPPTNADVWLHEDDVVDIEFKGTFDLTFIISSRNTGTNWQDPTESQWRVTGIPFEGVVTDLPASGDGASFVYDKLEDHLRSNQFHFAVQIKLKDDIDDLSKLAEEFDPRTPTVSWNTLKEYYDVSFPQMGEPAGASLSQNDLFRHSSDHNLGLESYRYSSESLFFKNNQFVKLFDVPTHTAVSMDVFRSVYFVDMPPFSFGAPQNGTNTLNAAFDRYFMTGIDNYWNPTIRDDKPTTALPNPNLVYLNWQGESVSNATTLRTNLSGQKAAERLFVAGSFDINSTSVAAWAAVLASPQYVKSDGATARPGVILHMPHEPLSDEDIEDAMSDSELASLSGRTFRDALFSQTVRKFDEVSADNASPLYQLAQRIVDRSKAWQQTQGRPFYSMEEFANSRVIENALADSNINKLDSKDIPKLSPLYISQAKIMGIISNFSNVRGDTFLIRSYGDSVDPISGTVRGSAICEAIVQRIPEYMDSLDAPDTVIANLSSENEKFGRRFRIIAFGWLERD